MKKKLSVKQFKKRIWLVLREAAILRDCRKCQICGSLDNLQVDHAFSRAIGRLHFVLEGLTTLCSRCHTLKSFKKGGAIDKQVDSIVRKREGQKWWDWALQESWKTCPEFSQRWWLQERLEEAQEKLDYYKKRVE